MLFAPCALPLLNITPAPLVHPMFACTGSQTFLEYRVQNTSGRMLTGLSYRPGASAFVETRSFETCGATLAAGATCTVALVYQAPATKAQGIGMGYVPLTVCVNERICEEPTSGNIIKLMVVPALKKAYIVTAATTVSVLDTRTNSVVSAITLPAGTANGVVLAPDLTRLYVASAGPNAIYVINTATNAVQATITPTMLPNHLVMSSDGRRLYAASFSSTSINVIDAATNALTTPTITLPGAASGLDISPDNGCIYTLNGSTGAFYAVNTATGAVTTVTTGVLTGTYDRLKVAADGAVAYVSNPTSATIAVVNLTNGVVTGLATTLFVGNGNMTLSPDGRFLYVVDAAGIGDVSIFDVANPTGFVSSTLQVPVGVNNINFTPDGTKAYTLNGGAGSISILKNGFVDVFSISIGGTPTNNSVGPFIG